MIPQQTPPTIVVDPSAEPPTWQKWLKTIGLLLGIAILVLGGLYARKRFLVPILAKLKNPTTATDAVVKTPKIPKPILKRKAVFTLKRKAAAASPVPPPVQEEEDYDDEDVPPSPRPLFKKPTSDEDPNLEVL